MTKLTAAAACGIQMNQKKEIAESVVFNLVQFYTVVLFECNEAEDYGPAMTLMNTAFTLHHEGNVSPFRSLFLYLFIAKCGFQQRQRQAAFGSALWRIILRFLKASDVIPILSLSLKSSKMANIPYFKIVSQYFHT